MYPAKTSVTLERGYRYGGGRGETAAVYIREACKANSIRLLQDSVKKSRKKWFPITNTKIRKLKDITEKVKAYYSYAHFKFMFHCL